jgi:hypothetical protein
MSGRVARVIERIEARTGEPALALRREVLLPWIPAILGYAIAIVLYVIVQSGRGWVGDDLVAYLAAGERLRLGEAIYFGQITSTGVFLYGPPWAVLFAPISLLPWPLVQVGVLILDLLCLRFLAGSWRTAGYLCLVPVTVYSMTSGNIDYLIAASLVLAWRSTSAPLVVLAAAKVAPALGVPIHRWREAVVTGAVLLVMTLPWLPLWSEWADFLIHQPTNAGLMLAIPWWVRLPFALALLIPRKPWLTALAVVVATPGFYWTTTILLLAPYRLWKDGDREPEWAPEPLARVQRRVNERWERLTAS